MEWSTMDLCVQACSECQRDVKTQELNTQGWHTIQDEIVFLA